MFIVYIKVVNKTKDKIENTNTYCFLFGICIGSEKTIISLLYLRIILVVWFVWWGTIGGKFLLSSVTWFMEWTSISAEEMHRDIKDLGNSKYACILLHKYFTQSIPLRIIRIKENISNVSKSSWVQ